MTSVMKKKLMGLAGLAICGFVLVHMFGNVLLFVSSDAYNRYSHALISTPLIYAAEAGLIAIFGLHVWIAVQLTVENWHARPVGYRASASSDKIASIASRTLIYTGILLGAFITLHLLTFKYGIVYQTQVDGKPMRDIYKLVQELFAIPWYSGIYVLCMAALGVHLSHTFSASFQTLGLMESNQFWLKWFGYLFAIFVAGGFAFQPLYFLLIKGGM